MSCKLGPSRYSQPEYLNGDPQEESRKEERREKDKDGPQGGKENRKAENSEKEGSEAEDWPHDARQHRPPAAELIDRTG